VGDEWDYRMWGFGSSHVNTYVISHVKEQDGQVLCTVSRKKADDELKFYQRLAVFDGGLTELEHVGSKSRSPRCLLRIPHRPGETWEETYTRQPGDQVNVRYTVGRLRRLEVPAGTYDTIPVEAVFQFPDPMTLTSWYAAGVGLVQEAIGGEVVGHLEAFRPSQEE
jgi:hypothetical protein